MEGSLKDLALCRYENALEFLDDAKITLSLNRI